MTRVLVAGDHGLARALRDAGAEVIYVDGTPAQLARTALQEDVDAIALAREHRDAVAEALAELNAGDIRLAITDESTADDLVAGPRT